jgi:hypothetical protein
MTADDVYKQTGYEIFSNGGDECDCVYSNECVSYYFSKPMTVVIPWSNDKFDICADDCEYIGMRIIMCPDDDQNSMISNLFPGLFDRKYKIVDVEFEEE